MEKLVVVLGLAFIIALIIDSNRFVFNREEAIDEKRVETIVEREVLVIDSSFNKINYRLSGNTVLIALDDKPCAIGDFYSGALIRPDAEIRKPLLVQYIYDSGWYYFAFEDIPVGESEVVIRTAFGEAYRHFIEIEENTEEFYYEFSLSNLIEEHQSTTLIQSSGVVMDSLSMRSKLPDLQLVYQAGEEDCDLTLITVSDSSTSIGRRYEVTYQTQTTNFLSEKRRVMVFDDRILEDLKTLEFTCMYGEIFKGLECESTFFEKATFRAGNTWQHYELQKNCLGRLKDGINDILETYF